MIDLSSGHGIRVNGKAVMYAEIKATDVVQVGDARLRVERTK